MSPKKSGTYKYMIPPGLDVSHNAKNPLKYILAGVLCCAVFFGLGLFAYDKFYASKAIVAETPVKSMEAVNVDVTWRTKGFGDPLASLPPLIVYTEPVVTQEPAAKVLQEVAVPVAKKEEKRAAVTETEKKEQILEKKQPSVPIVMPSVASDDPVYMGTSLLAQAQDALNQGNTKKAINYYKEASKYSNSPLIPYNIAILYIQEGQPVEAISWIGNEALAPEDKRDILMELLSRRQLDHVKVALDSFILTDAEGEFYYISGYYNELKNNLDEAKKDYYTAMERSGYDSFYTYAYARVLDMQGSYDEAIYYYSSVANYADVPELQNAAASRMLLINDIRR